jgi:hypothetical protein
LFQKKAGAAAAAAPAGGMASMVLLAATRKKSMVAADGGTDSTSAGPKRKSFKFNARTAFQAAVKKTVAVERSLLTATSAAPMMTVHGVTEGWLFKSDGKGKNWKRRWFVSKCAL